jgi:outer membrane protein
MKTGFKIALAAIAMAAGAASVAKADYDGNFMIRLQGTYVDTQDKLKSLKSESGAPVSDLKAAGFDATVSNTYIPAATLTYFLNKNLAVELFCCFSKHHVDLQAPGAFSGLSGKVAEAMIFPPALTLQYHFDRMGPLKPYVGVGVQYIHFFDETRGANTLNATSVSFSDAFGVTVQAGIDVAVGGGWYLNADVKKSWLDTNVTWRNSAVTGGNIVAKADLDPLIISVGAGYRFNLEDLLGRRREAAEAMK